MSQDPLDQKLNEVFTGKVVRKDLLQKVKKGTNVPSFVLEFLLARYCASDDQREIDEGLAAVLETIQKNYVRADESETEVGIEAVDSKGESVGRLGASPAANDATGAVRIRPGAAVSVGLKMDESYSGAFTVRVFDLKTHAILADLKLRTDYLE